MPGGDFGGRRRGAVPVEIGDRDQRAILGEPFGGRRPNPARPAGNQRHPPLGPSGHAFVLSLNAR